ncbi:MAG: 2-oxo acid dehydrogenase subunit E2 [Acidimicrobiales bacterium]
MHEAPAPSEAAPQPVYEAPAAFVPEPQPMSEAPPRSEPEPQPAYEAAAVSEPEPVFQSAEPSPTPEQEPVSASAAPPISTAVDGSEEPEEEERGVEERVSVGAVATAEVVDNGRSWRASVLSPVVRKLIRENDLDPGLVPGTGAGGRITRDDVLNYVASAAATTAVAAQASGAASAPAYAPPPRQAAPARPAVATPPAPVGVRDEIVPFSAVRRVTAEHMVRSIQTSVHTLVAIEADFENVERVRNELKDQFRAEEGIGLTYLPFVARAVIDVLRDYPNLNSSVGDEALVVHHDIHLGIAVDLQREGLIVPVIHNADGQSLRGIARSIADMARRAREKKLSADDITGGTFTITNPGPFGTFITSPIIAQPQVAILSTDGVKRKPVVMTAPDGTESIGIHSVGVLALVFDHRAVDGAYASAFVRDVASVIETRDWHAEL